MGDVRVAVWLENRSDRLDVIHGRIDETRVRRFEWPALVDTGATDLVLPEEAVEALGVQVDGEIDIEYADGSIHSRPMAHDVTITIEGRAVTLSVVVGPPGTTALVGQVVLEMTDLLVDCGRRRLVPRRPLRPLHTAMRHS